MRPAEVARRAVAVVVVTGALAVAPSPTSATAQVALAAAAPDAAHANPDTVTRRLVRTVNEGRRARAREWAKPRVVRKLFGLRADGFRLRYPLDQCQFFGAADGYVCAVNLRRDGVIAGTAYVTVRGPESDLLATRAAIALGE